MAEAPKAHKGPPAAPGQGEQLQQGQATEVNALAATPDAEAGAKQGEATAVDLGALMGVRPTEAPAPQGQPKYQSEDDQMLYGPTTRPDEPVTAGLDSIGRVTPSHDVLAIVPALLEAAKDPSAPPQLLQLLQQLGYHIAQSGEY